MGGEGLVNKKIETTFLFFKGVKGTTQITPGSTHADEGSEGSEMIAKKEKI